MASSMLGIEISGQMLEIAYWNGSTISGLISAALPAEACADGKVADPELFGRTIRAALDQAGIRERRAAIALPASESFLIRKILPAMTEKQLALNIPYEFKEFLSEPRENYYFDTILYRMIEAEEDQPRQMEIYAAAVLKEKINQYRQILKKAGLELVAAIPGESALSNVIAFSGSEEIRECALIEMEKQTTRLDFFTGVAYESTKIIEEGYESGTGERSEAYEKIAINVRRSVNFYGYSNRNSDLKDIYIYGSGASISEYEVAIREMCEDYTVKGIRELLPPVEEGAENPDCFVMAIGAAIQSQKAGLETLNLVVKEKKKQLRLVSVLVAVALILVLVAIFGKFFVVRRYDKMYQLQQEAEVQRSINESLKTALEPYAEVEEAYDTYADAWKTEEEQSVVSRSEIIEIIDAVIGNKAASVSIAENTVTVKAYGIDLKGTSGYVEQLNSYDQVLNVAVTSAVSKSESVSQPEVTFIIQMVQAAETEEGGSK